jgi:hypothetical protein
VRASRLSSTASTIGNHGELASPSLRGESGTLLKDYARFRIARRPRQDDGMPTVLPYQDQLTRSPYDRSPHAGVRILRIEYKLQRKMYLLMSAFHLAPWLRLLGGRRRGACRA